MMLAVVHAGQQDVFKRLPKSRGAPGDTHVCLASTANRLRRPRHHRAAPVRDSACSGKQIAQGYLRLIGIRRSRKAIVRRVQRYGKRHPALFAQAVDEGNDGPR